MHLAASAMESLQCNTNQKLAEALM